MKKIALLAFGLAGLIGIAACSSDTSLTVTTSNESGSDGTTGPPDATVADDTATDNTNPDLSLPPDVTLPDISGVTIPELSLPPGLTLPPGVTIPDISDITIPDISDLSIPSIPDGPGDSADCNTFTQIFGAVFTGADTGLDDIEAELEELGKTVPAELQGDFEVASEGIIALQELYAKYDYDYTKVISDPEALEIFANSEFLTAIGNLETYFAKECAGG